MEGIDRVKGEGRAPPLPGTGTTFLIIKFLITNFLITKFLITKFLITKFLICKVSNVTNFLMLQSS
jgi:hypothetical protein